MKLSMEEEGEGADGAAELPRLGLDRLSQPRPRPDRSPQRAARVRAQNRRLEYLRRHPGFVESSDREFANVKLYHDLVRSFQTPAERMAEAQDKGFRQVLEASILRNPERLERVGEEGSDEDDGEEEEEPDGTLRRVPRPPRLSSGGGTRTLGTTDTGTSNRADSRADTTDFGGSHAMDVDANLDPSRETARGQWHAFVRTWFVQGGAADDGFDYAAVDDDSDYDTLARADAEEAWYDDEAPGWASEEEDAEDEDTGEGGGRGFGRGCEKVLTGETGIQDF